MGLCLYMCVSGIALSTLDFKQHTEVIFFRDVLNYSHELTLFAKFDFEKMIFFNGLG